MSISETDDPDGLTLEERILETTKILEETYPDSRPLLEYRNAFELLIATILAAQCTDERVNQVTHELFLRFPDPQRMAAVPTGELEELIRTTGFFRAKANSVRGASRDLVERFDGVMPESIDDLISLPGVGRKTANVILGHCFGKPAVIVDTHMKRVAVRMGFSVEKSPDKMELTLKEIVPESKQTRFSMVVNYHGRYCCRARRPLCADCPVRHLCPYPEKT